MSQQLDPCNAYHTDEQRWAAVLARDAAADEAFVYAVKTTGVYCRPSSSARRPRRENVEFFATAEAAEKRQRNRQQQRTHPEADQPGPPWIT
ncbi:Ada metal-binding domain-containing protein, partial [Pseudomonas aeruginosa]|uniref:Ada metal-binding domain-containing protein n=1 Tax=Pseudomonas aeruginosa TaxID=287 RepID=UPI0024489A1F